MLRTIVYVLLLHLLLYWDTLIFPNTLQQQLRVCFSVVQFLRITVYFRGRVLLPGVGGGGWERGVQNKVKARESKRTCQC